MKPNELIVSVTDLLSQHGKTLIQVLTLVVVGLLTFMFGTVISDATHTTSVWLYFVLVVLSFTVIGVIIFWAIKLR